MAELKFDVNLSGSVFDGRAQAVIADACKKIEYSLAEYIIDRIHAKLKGVLRQNTGRYESYIHQEPEGDHTAVTDRWIVYGPWLEGVGSRNSPVTRFPGYHTFRIVAQDFSWVAADLARVEMDAYIKDANL